MNYTNYSTGKESNTNSYYNGENDDNHWRYIDDKKISKKDWERYFKKKKYPPKCEQESRDIWRKWFCYDDDWNDNCEDDDDGDGDEWWKRWH